ncbi:YjgN family protein [Kluyvera ascorbata]|uniref:YjgN family protein n=1 Tax=Kluyvera ascorbata TaxID=51288 RepID=UPI0035614437
MPHSLTKENRETHAFKFYGKGSSFFIICLVNVILSMITCGIFLPWALVRTRRYLYENMELNGARFNYHASGGAIFISWLALSIIIMVLGFIELAMSHSEEVMFTPWVFMLFYPFMMVKSMSYHAAMTTLNNVRFGFQCSMLRAWWVMIGMPIVTALLLVVIFTGYMHLIGAPSSIAAVITLIICSIVLGMIIIAAVNGIVYRYWIDLFAKNVSFGINKFDVNIKTSKCIIISIISMIILIPFILVISRIIITSFRRILLGSLDGYMGTFGLAYLLYIVGILLAFAYAFSALRNYAFNNLTLGDDIRFHSSLTFFGMAVNLLLLTFGSMITLGLAYPWLKIRFIHYQANHTRVSGSLNTLDLTNDERPLDNGIFARISRGAAPTLPFF